MDLHSYPCLHRLDCHEWMTNEIISTQFIIMNLPHPEVSWADSGEFTPAPSYPQCPSPLLSVLRSPGTPVRIELRTARTRSYLTDRTSRTSGGSWEGSDRVSQWSVLHLQFSISLARRGVKRWKWSFHAQSLQHNQAGEESAARLIWRPVPTFLSSPKKLEPWK